jgi:hypothetical protein
MQTFNQRHLDQPSRHAGRAIALGTILFGLMLIWPANGSAFSVRLGIFGGEAKDIAAYDVGGQTRLIAAVRSNKAGVRLDPSLSSWGPLFLGRPGELEEIEPDQTVVGTGAGTIFAILNDGKLISNASELSGTFAPSAWTTVTNGGVFHGSTGVVERMSTVLGHSSGTYVGTDDGNIYRTTDGGATWTLLASPVPMAPIVSITAYTDDANNPLLWATVDNAGTTELYPLTYSTGYTVGALMVVPSIDGVIERVFVYPDTAIADAPLIFVTGSSPSNSVYRGALSGSSWTTTTEVPHYFQQMQFDAVNGRIYAASGISTDQGYTFTSLPVQTRTLGDIHSNDYSMAIDPHNPSTVFYASDWFIGEYSIASGTWLALGEIALNSGVTSIQINDMAQIMTTSTTKDTFIIGGKTGLGITQDFLTHSGGFPNWTYPIFPADDGAPITATFLQDYDLDGAVIENVFAGTNGGDLYRATNQGLTAASYTKVFDPQVDAVGFYVDDNTISLTSIVASPNSADELYISFGDWDTGHVGGGVACSIDNGLTWQMDPAWVTLADSMLVQDIQLTNTKFWVGVGKADDLDPNHRGLYAKIGSLSGCGTGTFTKVTTLPTLDASIVYDMGGPITSPVYVATSGGLFRGELIAGLWSWTDMATVVSIPSGTAEYKAVTYNPTPSTGCSEEFYAATGDEVYRIESCGGIWSATLFTPPIHDEIRVLLWDELIVGTSSSLASVGHAPKRITKCRARFDKVRDAYIRSTAKTWRSCFDSALKTGVSCPSSQALGKLEKAQEKIDLGRKCSDDEVTALSDSWPGHCLHSQTVANLETCLQDDADTLVASLLERQYGSDIAARAGVADKCQKAIGRAYGGLNQQALKQLSKCERLIEKDEETQCPNPQAQSAIESAAARALGQVSRACTDSDVAAFGALGSGSTCDTSTSVATLHLCQTNGMEEDLETLRSPANDDF